MCWPIRVRSYFRETTPVPMEPSGNQTITPARPTGGIPASPVPWASSASTATGSSVRWDTTARLGLLRPWPVPRGTTAPEGNSTPSSVALGPTTPPTPASTIRPVYRARRAFTASCRASISPQGPVSRGSTAPGGDLTPPHLSME